MNHSFLPDPEARAVQDGTGRYVFDITDLRLYLRDNETLSGIQRVVVMTIAKAAERLGPEAVWLGYGTGRGGPYHVVPLRGPFSSETPDALRRALGVNLRLKSLPVLRPWRRRSVERVLRIGLFDLAAALKYLPLFRRHGLTPAEWHRLRRACRRRPDAPSPRPGDALRAGDRLVVLDNVRRHKFLEACFRDAAARGVAIALLVHDLIPIVTPHLTPGSVPRDLHNWLTRSTGYVTRYIANSRSTGRDLQRFLDSQGATQPVHVVPLAQASLACPASAPDGAGVDAALYPELARDIDIAPQIRSLRKHPFALVVGTLEVRKNLWGLARAWDRMRQDPDLALPKLVVAGRRGWLNEDFDALMAATGHLGGWVEIREHPSDRELDWLYRTCLFTAMTSFYEGWGLPIGESLAYGKTAVVSDTSSMPEVGGDLVEYCDPYDVGSIEAACRRLIADPDHRRTLEARIARTPLRSWDRVAAELIAAVAADAPADGTA